VRISEIADIFSQNVIYLVLAYSCHMNIQRHEKIHSATPFFEKREDLLEYNVLQTNIFSYTYIQATTNYDARQSDTQRHTPSKVVHVASFRPRTDHRNHKEVYHSDSDDEWFRDQERWSSTSPPGKPRRDYDGNYTT
jgi:hypothetical protein